MVHSEQAASRRGAAAPVPAAPPAGGVVFDCDGVLVDTTSCWDQAFLAGAGESGVTLDSGRLAELRGASLDTAASRIAQWSPQPVQPSRVLHVLRTRLVQAIDASSLALADGARELLDALYQRVCLGVASNSPRAVLLHVLARLEITEYFASLTSADDVARPKPAPDPYLEACRALAIDPPLSFAIEDSAVGMRSALAAGLTVIELAPAPLPSAERPGPALRVTSLADPRIAGLILGRPADRQSSSGINALADGRKFRLSSMTDMNSSPEAAER